MTLEYYPFFWGDYGKKTTHLTSNQHGVYFLLMRSIYSSGKPIPDNSRYQVGMAFNTDQQHDVDAILKEFFFLEDGYWHHEKITEIMVKSEAEYQKKVEGGRKGGKTRATNAAAKLKGKSSTPSRTPSRRASKTPSSNHNHTISKDIEKDYAFNGHVIKLSDSDWDKWTALYPRVDLYKYLDERDNWLAREGRDDGWFLSTVADLKRKFGS
ncbi:DUF1376 domain-containing protein [Dyadobacter sp. CY327]|uniref:YdaU family protein n=1 Tax=Dyadobacter sp. CY327 TaxID=2907301 RepID=UPI001F15F3DD|nr:DUF1376 domain-containing protein [Dyadobacter sp. CY327]MCE7073675.1 DUF1376 domain-containing protein [Dyadobacter sp. CY327]